MSRKPAPDKPTPTMPSGYLIAATVLLVLAPLSLLAWVGGVAALRMGARRWALATAGAVPGALALLLWGPRIGAQAALSAGQVLGAAGTGGGPSWALLGPLAAWFGRWVLLTAPVGVPAGMVAAAVPPRTTGLPRPEWRADEARAAQRAEHRARKRAAKRASQEGADRRSRALAVSLGGMVASWRIGDDLIVPPAGSLGLAWLLIGAPGAGKTKAIERLAYLAGLERRHLVVLDAKGGPDGLAAGVVAAYLAGWDASGGGRPPTIRTFPTERLDIWRGDGQAIVNRLVEVWDWTAESSWYREVAMTALRLAIGQPGEPCRSSAELVRRLDPNALIRAWEHDPLILGLVRNMAKDLPGVQVRVGNLVAALKGDLDGAHSWEDADCWVVTVPAMVASRDADSALRVLLSDYGHFTMARKGRRPSTLIVDEFSAIAGGRRLVIDLLERGRGAGAGVILAGQSSVALGAEDERARLLAAAAFVLLFRSPQPAELASLAGTERVAEAAWQVDGEEVTGRSTVTMRARSRVDQDQVRQLPTGEADLIVRGLKERVRIIPNDVDALRPGTTTAAAELVAGLARPRPAGALPGNPAPEQGPAGTVASREVPGPAQPPQEPSVPAGRPAAALDPPGPGRVRRYRPPGAGEEHPPDDRDNQEAPYA